MDTLAWMGAHRYLTGLGIAALGLWIFRDLLKRLWARLLKQTVGLLAEAALAQHQLELNRQLEDHKAKLQIAASDIQRDFERSMTDYRIHAERRHNAVRDFFAEISEVVDDITDWDPASTDAEWMKRSGNTRMAIRSVTIIKRRHFLYLPKPVIDAFEHVKHALSVAYVQQRNIVRRSRCEDEDDHDQLLVLGELWDELAKACRDELERPWSKNSNEQGT